MTRMLWHFMRVGEDSEGVWRKTHMTTQSVRELAVHVISPYSDTKISTAGLPLPNITQSKHCPHLRLFPTLDPFLFSLVSP